MAILVGLAFATSSTRADNLHLTDGRVMTGELVYEDDDLILFRIDSGDIKTTVTFKRSEIDSIDTGEAEPPALAAENADMVDGPSYIHIPLRGEIGYAVNNELLVRAFDLAKQHEPDAVVLEIDSDGGSVEIAIEMLATMTIWRHETHIPLVAFVNDRAISAASWIAAACDQVYLTPGGSIGGALIYSNKGVLNETPIGRKMESIFRGAIRGAVEDAGHNPLLVEAMVDPMQVVSAAVGPDGEALVWSGQPGQAPKVEGEYQKPPRLLVPPEQVLTLSGSEAVSTGLGKDLATSLNAVLTRLEIPHSNHASRAPGRVFEARYHEIQSVSERYNRLVASMDKSVIQGRRSAKPLKRRQDYLQQITRLQRVRRMLMQVRGMSEKYEWIAERVGEDLPRDPDALITRLDGEIDGLRNSMPKVSSAKPKIPTIVH